MFGDAMFDEEDRQRRSESAEGAPGRSEARQPETREDHFDETLLAAGGLEEHLRRRSAIAELLRQVGGY